MCSLVVRPPQLPATIGTECAKPRASVLVVPDSSSSVRTGRPVRAWVNVFEPAPTSMAAPSGPSRLNACCSASVRRCKLTAGPAMAANTQPHTSRASASVLPAAAPMARPGPRCPFRRLRLPIIRLSSRDVAGGSVARESVALLCPGAPSGGSQGPERDNQVAVVRGGLPTHLPCPLHLRAAGDQRRLGGAGELQADPPLFGRRGSVLILRSGGG